MLHSAERSRPWKKLPFGGISANLLRLLAMTAMLLDHAWATVVPGNFWMTCVGRLAFPIYAFQLTEGFFHTSDRKKYLRRLLFFALISEIPFNYVSAGGWFYPFHQNTIFTLALGLWAISALEDHRCGKKTAVKTCLVLLGATLLATVGMTDYGWKGVLMVILFYGLRGKGAWLGQLVCMLVINVLLFEGQTLPALWDMPLQGLAVLALIPIWLYNGKKGRGGKVMQYAAYWFYPAHLVLLTILRRAM